MTKQPESPYIANPNRLADVIAAIQVLAVYDFHMRSFESWAVSISGDKSKADYWKRTLEEHPEFFRLDTTRTLASLVWRRQFSKNYHVGRQQRLPDEECALLAEDEKKKLSRPPLAPTDIKTLIDTAINLHSRAIELRRESRWWVPLAGAVGALVGAILGGLLKLK